MLNSVGERALRCGTRILNVVWMCGFYMLCRLCVPGCSLR